MKIIADTGQLNEWLYNLLLVAPGKGEAKKTVSGGEVYFAGGITDGVVGMATDDILSIRAYLPAQVWASGASVSSVEALKAIRGSLDLRCDYTEFNLVDMEDVDSLETDLIHDFWIEHVADSIIGVNSDSHHSYDTSFFVSPDKLRKFSLLEPKGVHPLLVEQFRWNGRDLWRWSYGADYRGVLTLLDPHKMLWRDGRDKLPSSTIPFDSFTG